MKQMTFGQAVETMQRGQPVRRSGWNGRFLWVFMQVPSEVPAAIIPKMTSLPNSVKQIVAERGAPLRYTNQMAILHADNTINGWAPSVSDALANDWSDEPDFVVAGDTVGTAKPLE
jgi:hypothetical protein